MKFKSISTATSKNVFLSNSSLADTNPFTKHVCNHTDSHGAQDRTLLERLIHTQYRSGGGGGGGVGRLSLKYRDILVDAMKMNSSNWEID